MFALRLLVLFTLVILCLSSEGDSEADVCTYL